MNLTSPDIHLPSQSHSQTFWKDRLKSSHKGLWEKRDLGEKSQTRPAPAGNRAEMKNTPPAVQSAPEEASEQGQGMAQPSLVHKVTWMRKAKLTGQDSEGIAAAKTLESSNIWGNKWTSWEQEVGWGAQPHTTVLAARWVVVCSSSIQLCCMDEDDRWPPQALPWGQHIPGCA